MAHTSSNDAWRHVRLPVLPYSYLLRNPDSEEKLTKSGTSPTLDCSTDLA